MRRRMPGGRWSLAFGRGTRALGCCGLGLALIASAPALAQRPDPPMNSQKLMIPPPSAKHEGGSGLGSPSTGWWAGTAGMALALATFGGVSLAMKRWGVSGAHEAGLLRVVGRTSLSPRHAIYIVKVDNRTLLIGTGPQGPPSLLGEVAANDEQGGEK